MAAPNGLARIETEKKQENGGPGRNDEGGAPVRAQTIDELHSLQMKRSAPTTPIKQRDGAAAAGSPFAAALAEEERQQQQMQSIRCRRPPAPYSIPPSRSLRY
jgi:phosphoenolpyruvate carboxykinase (ATP)